MLFNKRNSKQSRLRRSVRWAAGHLRVLGMLATLLVGGGLALAALNPPAPPTDPSSQSYTLQQICDRLQSGATGTKVNTFTAPSTGPNDTMCTTDQLMALAPAADNTNGAVTGDVASGKTFWGLRTGAWGLKTGTGAVSGAPAPLAKTGQTATYATRDDGALQQGISTSPRFTDNSDGTIKDNLTGLIWLKNANCYSTYQIWAQAMTDANSLASGSCGLTDGSSAGQWRLPNKQELMSLIDYGHSSPALPTGHPFASVASGYYYWSSSTYALGTANAWFVGFSYGDIGNSAKTNGNYVWPVR